MPDLIGHLVQKHSETACDTPENDGIASSFRIKVRWVIGILIVYLLSEMKYWMKYLLLSIVALALHWGAKAEFNVPEDVPVFNSSSVYTSSLNVSITTPEADIYIPRQVSSVTAPRLQSNSNRHETSHRQNWEVVKSGKTIDAILRYFVQQQSLNIHSALMEPANKLVSLCRFII